MKALLVFLVVSVIVVSMAVTSVSAQSQYEIPAWVKGIASFWAEGKITDKDFGDGISFLIDKKIIQVPQIEKLESKIDTLDFENKHLTSLLKTNNDETNKESIVSATLVSKYQNGDKISVSGQVTNYDPETSISYTIKDPNGNLVKSGKISADSNGMFSHSFKAYGQVWDIPGKYSAEYEYQDNVKKIYFTYDTDYNFFTEYILVTTDKVQYYKGNSIILSGRVLEYLDATPVGYEIFDPTGERQTVGMINVNPDNTFLAEIPTESSMFNQSGLYKIIVHHGNHSRTAQVTFDFVFPTNGVKSIHFVKPLYFADEQFVLTGIENKGTQTVNITFYGIFGDKIGTVSATSNEDGTFDIPAQLVSDYFDKKGDYTIIAYTDEQRESNGISMKLEYNGNYVAESS